MHDDRAIEDGRLHGRDRVRPPDDAGAGAAVPQADLDDTGALPGEASLDDV